MNADIRAMARRDALVNAEMRLAEEWRALDLLIARGYAGDIKFCQSEIARLQDLIARLTQ